ncbi:MAG: protein phosphatase 2A regulatory subunit cdc55, partial [Paramarteilia canceri]
SFQPTLKPSTIKLTNLRIEHLTKANNSKEILPKISKTYRSQSPDNKPGMLSCIEILNYPKFTLAVAESTGWVSLYDVPSSSTNNNGEMDNTSSMELLFQSHTIQFDPLKSEQFLPNINCMGSVPIYSEHSYSILTCSEKTIKHFRIYDKMRSNFSGSNSKISQKFLNKYEGHVYYINAVSSSSNQYQFLSSDDLSINIWQYDYPKTAYGIVDIKPPIMDDLTEVISCAKYDPYSSHQFVYSTSRGTIHLCDEREHSRFPNHSILFFDSFTQTPSLKPFTDIVQNINDFSFSPDSNYIASRDYVSVHVWDKRQPITPVFRHEVVDTSKLIQFLIPLYNNESIYDRFYLEWAADSKHILSGFYSNTFKIVGLNGCESDTECYKINKATNQIELIDWMGSGLMNGVKEKISNICVKGNSDAFIMSQDKVWTVELNL